MAYNLAFLPLTLATNVLQPRQFTVSSVDNNAALPNFRELAEATNIDPPSTTNAVIPTQEGAPAFEFPSAQPVAQPPAVDDSEDPPDIIIASGEVFPSAPLDAPGVDDGSPIFNPTGEADEVVTATPTGLEAIALIAAMLNSLLSTATMEPARLLSSDEQTKALIQEPIASVQEPIASESAIDLPDNFPSDKGDDTEMANDSASSPDGPGIDAVPSEEPNGSTFDELNDDMPPQDLANEPETVTITITYTSTRDTTIEIPVESALFTPSKHTADSIASDSSDTSMGVSTDAIKSGGIIIEPMSEESKLSTYPFSLPTNTPPIPSGPKSTAYITDQSALFTITETVKDGTSFTNNYDPTQKKQTASPESIEDAEMLARAASKGRDSTAVSDTTGSNPTHETNDPSADATTDDGSTTTDQVDVATSPAGILPASSTSNPESTSLSPFDIKLEVTIAQPPSSSPAASSSFPSYSSSSSSNPSPTTGVTTTLISSTTQNDASLAAASESQRDSEQARKEYEHAVKMGTTGDYVESTAPSRRRRKRWVDLGLGLRLGWNWATLLGVVPFVG